MNCLSIGFLIFFISTSSWAQYLECKGDLKIKDFNNKIIDARSGARLLKKKSFRITAIDNNYREVATVWPWMKIVHKTSINKIEQKSRNYKFVTNEINIFSIEVNSTSTNKKQLLNCEVVQ